MKNHNLLFKTQMLLPQSILPAGYLKMEFHVVQWTDRPRARGIWCSSNEINSETDYKC